MSTKDLNIVIDHHYMSKVYTCGSIVSGHVEVKPRTDVSFSPIQIKDDYVLAHSTHLFLQLHMPVPESALPTPAVFKASKFYTVPFHFVIPHNLPDGSCHHQVQSSMIRRRHLQLPSTLTGWDKDDPSPDTMEVRYCVKAMISEKATNVSEEPLLKMESERFINLLATTRRLHKSKRTGSAEPVCLHLDGLEASGSSAQIHFTFTPSLAEMPSLNIRMKSMKISAHTWGFPRPTSRLPDLGSGDESLVLSTRHVTLSPHGTPRRGRNSFSSFTRTCVMNVSLRLPISTKVFPPAFHSCIISRTYSLRINFSIRGGHLSLILPIQIVMDSQEQQQGRCTMAKLLFPFQLPLRKPQLISRSDEEFQVFYSPLFTVISIAKSLLYGP
ncbi:hypothetical protein LZ32DRAFT_633319 [Colletotrichum eremochloae]|nr:hypothetical protein LZ32DRAFT_633319 [Colletotrichum eremochloae]